MKKLLSVALLVSSFAFAETVNIHAGWNLVGSSNSVDVSQINDSNIKIIWRWHNGEWQAYSKYSNIQNILNQKNITQFTVTDPNEGFWVYSMQPTTINLNASTNNTDTNQSYPIVQYLGKMYGYPWSQIVAFYPGDNRWKGNTVTLDYNTSDIHLIAYKKENQDSIAGVVTKINKQKGYEAAVNLITDNVASRFQALAIAKGVSSNQQIQDLTSTDNLTFIIFVNIRKNSINIGYEFDDNAGNYHYTTVKSQTFNEDLTNLTNTSDVKIKIYDENGTFHYSVVNGENESNVLVEGKFSVPNLLNFYGFDHIAFRSRIDDKNSQAQIDKSDNIVNDFNVIYYNGNYNDNNQTQQFTSAAEFRNSLNFTPVAISADYFAGKTIVTDGEENDWIEFINFGNNTLEWKDYNEDGNLVKSGVQTWNIDTNMSVMTIFENNNLQTVLAVKKIKNNTYDIVGYDFDDNDLWNDHPIVIDANVTSGTQFDPANLKSWFSNTSFVQNIDTNLLNKTWHFQQGTITFDTNNGSTVVNDQEGTFNGGLYINNNNIIVSEFPGDGNEPDMTAFILPYNLTESNMNAYVVKAFKDDSNNYHLFKIEEIHLHN